MRGMIAFLILSLTLTFAFAAEEDLTPFIQGEAMIAKSEEMALLQIEKLIKKYKGTPREPDLLYRQAELYMRRAKAGRFFDLFRNEKKVASLLPPAVTQTSAKSSIRKAISIYAQIITKFPKYADMDAVLFNKAFAHAQVGELKESERLYRGILRDHADSTLRPETLIALGELLYDSQNFTEALSFFQQYREYKNSKMLPFSIYKSAWSLYNLRRTEEGLKQLEDLIALQPKQSNEGLRGKYYLRTEAQRDMVLFFADVHSADKAVSYFKKYTDEEEFGTVIILLAKLYEGHSRQKELTLILNDFQEDMPLHAKQIEALTFVAESYEGNKEREKALSTIEKMHQLCKIDSPWYKINKDRGGLAACQKKLPDYTMAVAKRWWEVWEKNKDSKALAGSDLAKATQKIFQLHLNSEVGKTDFKSRFIYAELLFQNKEFPEASIYYEEVARNTSDVKLRHDATYSAIVCLDKSIEANKTLKGRLLTLVEFYLDKNPKGEYFSELQYKQAQLYMDNNNRLKAEEIAKSLLKDKSPGLRKKSEDLYLDLLILRQEYKMTKDLSAQALKNETEPVRKDRLTKLYKESHLLLIDSLAKSGKEVLAADQFLAFYQEHKGTERALDALWKSISLYFANGRMFEGAEASWIFANQSSDKEKVKKALEQATSAYLSVGQLKKAALAQEQLLKSETDRNRLWEGKWLMAELFEMDLALGEAERIFFELYKTASKDQRSQVIEKLQGFYKNDSQSPNAKQIQADIINHKIEPFFTNSKILDLREEMRKSQFSKAFESAKKIISSDGTLEQRTEARLAQAFILELEHNSQSVKSSIDRLATVLAIKTEKLDKASSSYSQALKMAKDVKQQLQALEGLRRVYNNYVSSLSNLSLTSEVGAEDMKVLKAELRNLTDPMAEKEIEVSQRLQQISTQVDIAGTGSDFSSLAFSETYTYPVSMPRLEDLRDFVPSWPEPKRWLDSREISSQTCTEANINENLPFATLGENANKCLKAKSYKKVELVGLTLLKKDPKSPWGALYLAQAAQVQRNLLRAEWFFNLALQKETKSSLLYFQRARLMMLLDRPLQAREDFNKSIAVEVISMDQRLFRGLLAFQQGKCTESVEDLNMALKSSVGREENSRIALSECYAKLGKIGDAVSVVESGLRSKKNLLLYLQVGRIAEVFQKDVKKATEAYTAAMKVAESQVQKDWLQGKLNYLGQTGSKVTQHVNSHDHHGGTQL